jgi:hypothetical protein
MGAKCGILRIRFKIRNFLNKRMTISFFKENYTLQNVWFNLHLTLNNQGQDSVFITFNAVRHCILISSLSYQRPPPSKDKPLFKIPFSSYRIELHTHEHARTQTHARTHTQYLQIPLPFIAIDRNAWDCFWMVTWLTVTSDKPMEQIPDFPGHNAAS